MGLYGLVAAHAWKILVQQRTNILAQKCRSELCLSVHSVGFIVMSNHFTPAVYVDTNCVTEK